MLAVYGGFRWLRSTCARLKRPLPLHSGFNARNPLVLPHGNDPRSSGYRPGALPLSYRRMVRLAGVDPATSAMSARRSTAELKTRGAPPSMKMGTTASPWRYDRALASVRYLAEASDGRRRHYDGCRGANRMGRHFTDLTQIARAACAIPDCAGLPHRDQDRRRNGERDRGRYD
jgi:hypothetical protein